MVLSTKITVGPKSVSVRQVYQRVQAGREEFLREARKRNPSLGAVQAKQKQQFGK